MTASPQFPCPLPRSANGGTVTNTVVLDPSSNGSLPDFSAAAVASLWSDDTTTISIP